MQGLSLRADRFFGRGAVTAAALPVSKRKREANLANVSRNWPRSGFRCRPRHRFPCRSTLRKDLKLLEKHAKAAGVTARISIQTIQYGHLGSRRWRREKRRRRVRPRPNIAAGARYTSRDMVAVSGLTTLPLVLLANAFVPISRSLSGCARQRQGRRADVLRRRKRRIFALCGQDVLWRLESAAPPGDGHAASGGARCT